jgi:predicted dehydrogenase
MGDLGPHACVIPLRAGWRPRNVRAVLSNIMRERPDGRGNMVPCETWDNATLLCEAEDPVSGGVFPWHLRIDRIAPGEKNNWYIEIYGTRASVRYSLKDANALEVLEYKAGGEQAWRRIDLGHEVTYQSITGEIFQFGVGDAILQMWAAFLHELHEGAVPARFAGCVTPEESVPWHRLFTAALTSQATGITAQIAG